MSMREDWEQRGWEAGYAGQELDPLLIHEADGFGYGKLRNTYIRNGYAEGKAERERRNGRVA